MKSIQLLSGSIFAGNPIVLRVTPSHISGDNIAFHRIIVKVIASLLIDDVEATAPVTIPMSVSLFDENPQNIDISSALRSVLDGYEYIPHPTVYPIVKWRVVGYDEFMQDGSIFPPYEELSFPAPVLSDGDSSPSSEATVPDADASGYAYCIAGDMPENQRILKASLASVKSLSDMPTSAMLFPKGKTFAYTPSFPEGITLPNSHLLTSPVSQEALLDSVGSHFINGHSLYALDPATYPRTIFRFINRYGVLESVSVPQYNESSVDFDVKEYASGKPQTFNSIRHGIVRKSNDRETLTFVTDPLMEEWIYWYLHEFFMAENVWMELSNPDTPDTSAFVRCHIMLDDNVSAIRRNSTDGYVLQFKVKLDINGHI